MPRVSADRMDELTDYEFEYEFLQDAAFKAMLKEFANDTKLDVNSGGFNREFSMDETEYEHIVDISLTDAFLDFEIPEDASEGRRLSDILIGSEGAKEDPDEFEPVDLSQEFGIGEGDL
jgi:hypothetical protein